MPLDPDSPLIPGNPGYGVDLTNGDYSLLAKVKGTAPSDWTFGKWLDYWSSVPSFAESGSYSSGPFGTTNTPLSPSTDPNTGLPKPGLPGGLLDFLKDIAKYVAIFGFFVVLVLSLVLVLDVISFLPRKRA